MEKKGSKYRSGSQIRIDDRMNKGHVERGILFFAITAHKKAFWSLKVYLSPIYLDRDKLKSFKLVYFYSDWICDQPRYICDTFTHVRQSDFDNRFSILESFTTLMTEPAPEFGSFSTPLNLYCSVTMQDRVWLRKRTTTKKRPKIFGDKPQ